ncbi:MAG: carboxymuconolactone decarboxylase family protein [Gammaproteobacteria bacterium]|nr:carboxymuconolactone decarboxylase family protein [Gammaproteobacteria bacterium]
MSRIPLVEPDGASPEVKAAYKQFEEIGFPIMNVMKMFANNGKVLQGFVQIAQALYVAPRISPRYRELAYLRASQVNSCHY